jgi:hypothetical protein
VYRRQSSIVGSSLVDYVDSGVGYWYLVTTLVIITIKLISSTWLMG